MFTGIVTVLFLLAAAVGVTVYLKNRKQDLSALDSPAHEVMAVEFEHLRARGDKPVVVMFFATWCSGCRTQTPIFRRVAKELDSRFHFVFIDVDKNQSLANRLEVKKIPVLMVFTDTEGYADKKVGVLEDKELKEFILAAVS